nr:hypothetical protein [Bradyrhizobium sp.]
MNWAWATSLDQLWRSPTFPMWLTLAAAGFFAVIVLVTLLRAEKSVANGALTVITLLAIGVAVAATIRGFGTGSGGASGEAASLQTINVSLPALSCIDDLAGESVLAACEKSLFGSAESAAAAVSYAASLITQLTALGDVAAANRTPTPELQALRRAVERDRYGLVAQALVARDHCTLSECPAFRAISDTHQIVINMDQHAYDGLVSRYAPSWNAPAATAPVAALSPSMPTGRPTNAEFPTAASTPAVSIMTPEPGSSATPPAPRAPASAANASSPTPTTAPVLAAAKKPAPKPKRTPAPAPAPVQVAPAAAPPPPPAASND